MLYRYFCLYIQGLISQKNLTKKLCDKLFNKAFDQFLSLRFFFVTRVFCEKASELRNRKNMKCNNSSNRSYKSINTFITRG